MKNSIYLFFLLLFNQIFIFGQNENTNDSIPPLSIISIEFKGSCDEAKSIIINKSENDSVTPGIYNAALLKVSECNLLTYAENHLKKEPKGIKEEHKYQAVIIQDFNDNKQYYGFIKGKHLKRLKKYSTDIVSSVGKKIAKTEPISGTMLVLTSEVSINSFYKAAVKEDPTLFLQPMSLPGIEFSKITAGIIDEEFAENLQALHDKFVKSLKEDSGKIEKTIKRNPLWVLNPQWAASSELFEESMDLAKETTEKGTSAMKKNPSILLAPQIIPLKIISDLF